MTVQNSFSSRIAHIASSIFPSSRRKSSFASKGKSRSMTTERSLSSISDYTSGSMASSPPLKARISYDPAGTPPHATNLLETPLAHQGYPHIHIREKVFANCRLTPKHSVEDYTYDCTCGKVVVERYREWVAVDNGECQTCKQEDELFEDF